MDLVPGRGLLQIIIVAKGGYNMLLVTGKEEKIEGTATFNLFVKQEVEQESNRVTRGRRKLLITALNAGHTTLSLFLFLNMSTVC